MNASTRNFTGQPSFTDRARCQMSNFFHSQDWPEGEAPTMAQFHRWLDQTMPEWRGLNWSCFFSDHQSFREALSAYFDAQASQYFHPELWS